MPLHDVALQSEVQVAADFRVQAAQPLFLFGAGAPPIFGLPRRRGQFGRTEPLVSDALGRQRILGQALPGHVELQSVAILQDFDRLALRARHPIVIALKGGIAVLIGAPLMHLVRRRQMGRQLGQVGAFMLEGFGRNEPGFALGPVLQAHRRPLKGLAVEVVEVQERASGQKVRLDGPEAALFAGFAVRVPLLMTPELEAILLGEGLHLRDHHRLSPAAPQASQVGVIDNALPGDIPPVSQGFMKEALQLEAIEGAVKLQVAPFGVAQVKQAGHDALGVFPQRK